MRKAYITGCVLSGILHLPLLKDEEYVAFLLATSIWPVPFIMWTAYLRYLIWGTYSHRKMMERKLGCYSEQVQK